MHFLEPSKDDINALSSSTLEELVVRLCECELIESGGSRTSVRGSGDINANDGGIDVLVDETKGKFPTEFIPCKFTGFQVKKTRVEPRQIEKEMCPKGKIRESIIELANNDGAYIIVSSYKMNTGQIKRRTEKMQAIIKNLKIKQQLKVDFYDLAELHLWVRKHISVLNWVNEKIGKNTVGWQSHGRWSQPHKSVDDLYINSDDEFVTISGINDKPFVNFVGLELVRNVIRNTDHSVRIIGLTGVGKTRFAQALFENTFESNPLNPIGVIYCDLVVELGITPNSMIESIKFEDHSPIIVVDNCPFEEHVILSNKLSSFHTKIKLITIDNQMDEGTLENTIQVKIGTVGSKVATALALERYPQIGKRNARHIAKFAGGNPELTLKIAQCFKDERVSLTKMSNDLLIKRLLYHQDIPINEIRKVCGVISLVDSFAIEDRNPQDSQLSILAELADLTYRELYRIVKILMKKELIRKNRNDNYSVEPTVLANMLASETLEQIPRFDILKAFNADSNILYLKAFAKRLRYLHDSLEAQEIVKEWLNKGGILDGLLGLSDDYVEILRDIAPVVPKWTFRLIKRELKSTKLSEYGLRGKKFRRTVINLVKDLANDKKNFEYCVRSMIELARMENKNNYPFDIDEQIGMLFQPLCSDTNASIVQKKTTLEQLVLSSDQYTKNIGISLLYKVLGWPYWFSNENKDFGAQPLKEEFANFVPFNESFSIYLTLVEKLGTGSCEINVKIAKDIMEKNILYFLTLGVRTKLLSEIIRKIHKNGEWIEMWVEMRKLMVAYQASNFDNSKHMIEFSENLEKLLRPKSLMSKINTYVLRSNINTRYLDDDYVFGKEINEFSVGPFTRIRKKCLDLGKQFIKEDYKIEKLGDELFEWKQYNVLEAFGKGLASVTTKIDRTWSQLVSAFESSISNEIRPDVIIGFIEAVDQADRVKSRKLLKEVPKFQKLSYFVIELYSLKSFSEQDFESCVDLILAKNSNKKMVLNLLTCVQKSDLNESKKSKFTEKLLQICSDEEAVLEVIELVIFYFETRDKMVEPQVLKFGFETAIKALQKRGDQLASVEYSLSKFLKYFFSSKVQKSHKSRWCKELFATISKQKYSGFISGKKILELTAALMPHEFLNCLFDDKKIRNEKRIEILETLQSGSGILSAIDSKTIIEWCQHTDNIEVWKAIAKGVKCLEENENGTSFKLAQSAKDFLNASPNPKDILDIFAESLDLWDPIKGFLIDEIENRLNAFNELVDCTNEEVSKSANDLIQLQSKLISHRREIERKFELPQEIR